jgi:sec-independent protein translocase protein TatC
MTFTICNIFADEILYIISSPLLETTQGNFGMTGELKRLIYTDITEAFFTQLILSLYLSIYIILPNIMHHTWFFLKPGLYKNEKLFLKRILPSSFLLFLLGILFSYIILLPIICNFFVGFEINSESSLIQVELEAKISNYINIVLSITFLMGILSQYPILLLISLHLGLINFSWLTSNRKIFIMTAFVFGAICTPPDVISQLILALLLLVLYEGTLLFILINQKYVLIGKD